MQMNLFNKNMIISHTFFGSIRNASDTLPVKVPVMAATTLLRCSFGSEWPLHLMA